MSCDSKRTPSYCYCPADGSHGLFRRLIYSLVVSQWNSHAPRLHVELLPADPGGLLVEVLVTFGLLPHVVILNALTDRARSYLVGRDNSFCLGAKKKNPTKPRTQWAVRESAWPGRGVATDLVSLNEVEVFSIDSIAVLKVPALLLAPGTQLFCRMQEKHCGVFESKHKLLLKTDW